MIVENDKDTRFLLSTILAHDGIKTTMASSGQEALTKLESGELPDLIVTDMTMPGMNGDELVARIHHDLRTKNIPVLLSTGHWDIRLSAGKMGCQGYLSKPYTVAKTLALIHAFIPAGALA